MTELQTGADFRDSAEKSSNHADFTAIPILQDIDLRNIRSALIKGDDGLAKRKDLGEMHKRLVAMFTTLNQGIGESQALKVAADRAQIDQRMDQMERALNSMEGALRIELGPMLEKMVSDVMSKNNSGRRSYSWRSLSVALVFAIGVAMGVFFEPKIQEFSAKSFSFASSDIGAPTTRSSPDGGIFNEENLVK